MENKLEKFRILVVDDEEDICEILKYNLQQAGYVVDAASSSEEALFKIKNPYHLLLLDIMMDGISGLKLAQLLREEYGSNVPIIFISALDTEADILSGFNRGGDDYIPKPFSVKEVLARVNAVLTRCYNNNPDNCKVEDSAEKVEKVERSGESGGDVFSHKNLVIEFDNKRVFVDDVEVVLTKKENEILILMAKNPNKIFSREDILAHVWKEESFVLDRTVDVHIARLRKKIGKCGDWIVNRSGYGYSLHV